MSTGMEFVRYALSIGAIELLPQGRQLKSGRLSPYFFNSGLFVAGKDIEVLCSAYAQAIKENWKLLGEPEIIFGPAYKGIPLSYATAVLLWQHFRINIAYAHDRKETKKHGESGSLVGADMAGKRVLIIDDVITTGGTKDEAVEIITSAAGKITGVIVAFDRNEKSDTSFSALDRFSHKHNVPVVTVSDVKDLQLLLSKDSSWEERFPTITDAIASYMRTYGA